LPFAGSELKVTANNTINVTGAIIDAWRTGEAVSFNVGGKDNNLNAVTYLSNYSVVPVTSAPKANATLNKTDTITFTDADIKSVSDIVVNAGKGANSVVGYSEGRDIYREIAAAIAGFFGADADFTLKGGKSRKNANGGVINFKGDNSLEAGMNWLSRIVIGTDGNVDLEQTSAWLLDAVLSSDSQPASAMLDEQIKTLNAKIALLNSMKASYGQYNIDLDAQRAFEMEIEYLNTQLNFYKINGQFPNINILSLSRDITASSGDIIINAATLNVASGTILTARSNPTIEIINHSPHFLRIEGATLEIPARIGGRIMVNGNLATSHTPQGLANATLNSIGNTGARDPMIRIVNTWGGNSNSLASDLMFRNANTINPNGKIEIESKGSIWVENTNITGRDVSIKTDAAFFHGYTTGMYGPGGDPYGVGTNIYRKILDWMFENMAVTGNFTGDLGELLVQLEDLRKELAEVLEFINGAPDKLDGYQADVVAAMEVLRQFVTPASFDVYAGRGGSGEVGELVFSGLLFFQPSWNAARNAYMKGAETFFDPLTLVFRNTMQFLQANSTPASLVQIFGVPGTGRTTDLVIDVQRVFSHKINEYNTVLGAGGDVQSIIADIQRIVTPATFNTVFVGTAGSLDTGQLARNAGVQDDFDETTNTDENLAAILKVRRALADAEWDDVVFSSDGETMTIYRYDNVNIEASGTLKVQSGGWTNIGSQGDIVIDNKEGPGKDWLGIIAGSVNDTGQALRLKTDGAIFAVDPGYIAIQARNAVLEAAGGTLGSLKWNSHTESWEPALLVNLTGGNAKDGWITARGSDGVYLYFVKTPPLPM